MRERVYELIKRWAGVPTWHTGHPHDQKRFHAAIRKLHEDVGPGIDSSDIRHALARHREENPEILGGKATNEKLEEYVDKAMTILDYLNNE